MEVGALMVLRRLQAPAGLMRRFAKRNVKTVCLNHRKFYTLTSDLGGEGQTRLLGSEDF